MPLRLHLSFFIVVEPAQSVFSDLHPDKADKYNKVQFISKSPTYYYSLLAVQERPTKRKMT